MKTKNEKKEAAIALLKQKYGFREIVDEGVRLLKVGIYEKGEGYGGWEYEADPEVGGNEAVIEPLRAIIFIETVQKYKDAKDYLAPFTENYDKLLEVIKDYSGLQAEYPTIRRPTDEAIKEGLEIIDLIAENFYFEFNGPESMNSDGHEGLIIEMWPDMKLDTVIHQKIVDTLNKDFDEGFRAYDFIPFIKDRIKFIAKKFSAKEDTEFYTLSDKSPSFKSLKPILYEIYDEGEANFDVLYEKTKTRSEYRINAVLYEDIIYIRVIEGGKDFTYLIEKI